MTAYLRGPERGEEVCEASYIAGCDGSTWPEKSLWLPDPAKPKGTEAERNFAFADTLRMLTNRIGIFVSLPLDKLSRLSLQKKLDEIGQTSDEASKKTA